MVCAGLVGDGGRLTAKRLPPAESLDGSEMKMKFENNIVHGVCLVCTFT
jgi:hypothetical protein